MTEAEKNEPQRGLDESRAGEAAASSRAVGPDLDGGAELDSGASALPREALRAAAIREHYRNAVVGVVLLPVAIGLMGWQAGLGERSRGLFVAALFLAMAGSAVRLWLLHQAGQLRLRAPRRWDSAYRLASILHHLVTGLLTAWIIVVAGTSQQAYIAIATAAIIAMAAAFTHTLDVWATVCMALADLAPATAAMMFVLEGRTRLSLLFAFLALVLYLGHITLTQYRNRWRPLEMAYLAEQRAHSLAAARLELDRLRERLEQRVAERTAELTRATTEYRTIFDCAHDPIIVFDPDGERVLRVNRRACEVYGVAEHEFVGKSLLAFTTDAARSARQVQATLSSGGVLNFETVQRRADGSPLAIEVSASRIDLDGRPVILSINRDLSERRRVEQLEEAKEAAERADRAKSQFLAHMSHEIRTPMAGVLGLAELLAATELGVDQRRYVTLMHSSTESLLRLIDDILDFARIEAGHLDVERQIFDLHSTVRGVVDLLSVRAASKGLELTVTVDPRLPTWCVGDPGRLRQVLLNLVGNAVKFTHRGQVSVEVGQGEGETIRVEVADTGIGIPAELRDRLFQPFSQGDASAARRFGGSGLGLAITKRLVEAMGGEIDLESGEGRGARFWFAIPLVVGTAPDVGSRASPAQVMPVFNVLIAEDDAVSRLVLVSSLRALGQRVTETTNGAEVIAALDHEAFDIVFMDCQMPGMDGFEATRRIRARGDARAGTPIIAATAHAMEGDRLRCLAAGMTDYLSKPYRIEDLRAALERWAPSSRSQGAATESGRPSPAGAPERSTASEAP